MADRIPLIIEGSSIREIPSDDRLDVRGALEVNGHVTPGADSSYDIGTSSLKFRDIFLSSGTIHLGGVKLRADGNKLSIQDSTGAVSSLASSSRFVSGDSGSSAFRLAVSDAISVATSTGLGSLAYDSAKGQFALTGVTQANVMSTMQAGTGIGIDSASGTLSIGQAVGTTDSVTFAGLYASGNVILGGNLTVNGTTTTVNSTNSLVADPLIELNTGAGSNANDLGFVFERGSTGNNAAFIWDESEDKFKLGTTTATGASTGNMTVATGSLIANLTGDVTGDVSGTAGTATVATTVTVSDNENTNENNVILFGAGAAGSGNIGVEADGNMTYNPSTGKITATGFVGALTGNADTATALATARAIQISGDVTGTANFDGSAAINITAAIAANTISSTELLSASTLLIKNTAGSTLKTVIGAGS